MRIGAVEMGNKRRAGYARLGEDDGPMRDVQCCDCGCALQVSQGVWEMAKLASSALVERGEKPLGNDEITRCKPCVATWSARRLAESLELERRIGYLYDQAKATGEFVAGGRRWLVSLGYWNDVHAIEERCKKFKERQASGGAKSRRKGDL